MLTGIKCNASAERTTRLTAAMPRFTNVTLFISTAVTCQRLHAWRCTLGLKLSACEKLKSHATLAKIAPPVEPYREKGQANRRKKFFVIKRLGQKRRGSGIQGHGTN